MQQEWQSASIMTSRRRTQTGVRLRQFLAIAFAVAMLNGCAALPQDSTVFEQLDAETGITVARLGRPLELYRETFLREPAGKFAFLGPFETNLMGTRELYLWVALPVDPSSGSEPIIEMDGTALSLGSAGRDAEFAGLRKSPYKIPTPWSAMFYYKVDAALIGRLADATQLSIRAVEATKDGTVKTLFAAKVEDSRLRDFAQR
jgi:hypothetical protein